MNILGVDPGREKTGLAVVDFEGTIQWRAIIETARLKSEIEPLLAQWNIERVALGNSTSSNDARARLEGLLEGKGIPLEMVDEKNSTVEARALYFEAHPPRGWRRLLLFSSQVPPVPVDDFAAVVVARRSLDKAKAGGL
jgi:RNase H-fold protein (predicted Holliday junction resolvase)